MSFEMDITLHALIVVVICTCAALCQVIAKCSMQLLSLLLLKPFVKHFFFLFAFLQGVASRLWLRGADQTLGVGLILISQSVLTGLAVPFIAFYAWADAFSSYFEGDLLSQSNLRNTPLPSNGSAQRTRPTSVEEVRDQLRAHSSGTRGNPHAQRPCAQCGGEATVVRRCSELTIIVVLATTLCCSFENDIIPVSGEI